MADKKISLKKNFIMNAILTMSAFIFPLITFPYVARVLGPEGTGRVSYATSLVSYFNMFAMLGIPTYGVRACAKVRDDKKALSRCAEELLIINLVMSAAAYTCFFAALIFLPGLREDRLLYIIVSATILFNTIGMEWLYKGLEKYSYITIRSVIFKFIALILMFFVVREKQDYVWYGMITVFAASASGIVNFIHARRYIIRQPFSELHFRPHLKAVGIFFAMACATTVYTHLDVLMLGSMTTKTDVGYYNAAVRIKTILVSIVTSLGTVLLPRSSYYVERGEMGEFRRISSKALHFVILFACPLALYFMLFARAGIYFLAGSSAFEGAVVPMQIIMPTLVLIGITNILGIQILVPLGREKVVLYSEIAGAATDLVLNALLIPRFLSSGAALGTLAAEIVVLAVQYAALKDQVRQMLSSFRKGNIAAALVIAAVISVWVPFILRADSTWQYFVQLVVTAVLFFGAYVLYLTWRKEDLMLEIEGIVLKRLKRIR